MLTLPLSLLLAALVCFVVALLIAATGLAGNYEAWLAGGFVAVTLSMLLAPFAPAQRPPQ